MQLAITASAFHVLNMRTRFPFRYGIASMSALPHLLARVELTVEGTAHTGLAAEGLAPKWFTKIPDESYRDELSAMLEVVRHAAALAVELGPRPALFAWWLELYQRQMQWAAQRGLPPLLAQFAVSLIERAAIDALCRAAAMPFHRALQVNLFGIRLGQMHDELAGRSPADLLPPHPCEAITVRHTVGLTDPLEESDIGDAERVSDGLPQSLLACIAGGGLTHFKIKLSGDACADSARLVRLSALLGQHAGDYRHSLDANENFRDLPTFRSFWQALCADDRLAEFRARLLFVEQPLHRDVALADDTLAQLSAWTDRPPIIIDESDATLHSCPRAMGGGYAGTSHKNCKGVFKGVANACLIEHRRRGGAAVLLSCEDLCNLGPVALLQDLAVVAALGVSHAERNGHHYFAGLSMFPEPVQSQVLALHADLYRQHRRGFAMPHVHRGQFLVGSVNAAPFGVALDLDTEQFTPLDQWRYDSLEATR